MGEGGKFLFSFTVLPKNCTENVQGGTLIVQLYLWIWRVLTKFYLDQLVYQNMSVVRDSNIKLPEGRIVILLAEHSVVMWSRTSE